MNTDIETLTDIEVENVSKEALLAERDQLDLKIARLETELSAIRATALPEAVAPIAARHHERQAKIDKAAADAADGNALAALCHGPSQEHADGAALLDAVRVLTIERDTAQAQFAEMTRDREGAK